MTQPLINVGPGGAMEAGIASARHPESVEFWHDGENVSFRNLGVEKAIGPGEELIHLGSPVIRLAQAYVSGTKRVYFQDATFRVWGWNEGSAFPFFIGEVAAAAQLEPYGDWLLIVAGGLWVWKGSGAIIPAGPAGLNLVGKLKEHVLFADGDELLWPDVRNPEDFLTGSNKSAGRLTLRNLESDLLALRPLAGGLGLYSRDTLRLVRYRGAGVWFGLEGEPLDGIGAIGPNSVVSAGFRNYGLNRNGFFSTDGSQFQYIDTPAFHGYLESRLDWTREAEVFGFHNENFQEIVWFYPTIGGDFDGISYKYTNGAFSRYALPILAAADRQVFSAPLFGTESGVSLAGRTSSSCFVRSKPLDAGNSLILKFFEHYRFVGTWENATLRLGAADQVNASPEWFYEGPLETEVYEEREAVFLTIEISAEEGWFEISQIFVGGEPAGNIL